MKRLLECMTRFPMRTDPGMLLYNLLPAEFNMNMSRKEILDPRLHALLEESGDLIGRPEGQLKPAEIHLQQTMSVLQPPWSS